MKIYPLWQAALARIASGTGDARILCIGDSTTAGAGGGNTTNQYLTAWPAKLAALLGTATGKPASNSAITAPNAQTANTIWTYNSDWTLAGIGFMTCLTANVVGASLTFAASALSDTYDIYFFRTDTTGTFTASASGGSPLAVNTVGTSTASVDKATVTAGSASTSNVVTVTHTAGNSIFIVAIEPRRASPKQILVANIGQGGTTSGNWYNPALAGYDTLTALPVYAPSLTIIGLGINDAQGSVAATTVKSNIKHLVAAAQATGDVIVSSPVPSDPALNGGVAYANESSAHHIYQEIADETGCGYVDVWTALGGAYQANLMTDTVHPNDAGYQRIAQAVLAELALSLPSPPSSGAGRIRDRVQGRIPRF